MTTRLYYTDARRLEFDATVVALADDARRVVLDRSAFYPTSGGQPHDTGVLDGIRVLDVVDEDERVVHLLEAPLRAAVGDRVAGMVDETRRRDHMQQHSGQHLLSAVFAELHGADTVSVHFGPESSLVELDVEAISREQLVAVEARANAIVREARPVTVTFEDAATAIGLRKSPSRAGTLRIVTIEGVDRSACGGTHVATTAEIGPLLLRRAERMRQRVRVEFVAGERAIVRARSDYELLGSAAHQLSASSADVPQLVASQAERVRELENERKSLLQSLGAERARQMHAAAAPDADGLRLATERIDGALGDLQRQTAQAFAALPKAVYLASADEPPTVLLAASSDSGINAGAVLKSTLAAAGGRGGGSPQLAQGSVPNPALVAEVARAVEGAVRR